MFICKRVFSESLYVLYNLYKVLENCIIKKFTSHLKRVSSAVEITGIKWLCAMHIFVMYPVIPFLLVIGLDILLN